MNRNIKVTDSFFQEMQKSKGFFESNILENEDFNGYDVLVNIDTGEKMQISSKLSPIHYNHEQKYKKAIEIVGIENLKEFFPLKSKEELLKNVEDIHLNGKYQRMNNKGLMIYDLTHSYWLDICKDRKIYNKLTKLGVINSPSCWASILKNAMKIYYNVSNEEIQAFLNV